MKILTFRNQDCTNISELSNTSENDDQNADDLVWSFNFIMVLMSNGNFKTRVENVGHLILVFVVYSS